MVRLKRLVVLAPLYDILSVYNLYKERRVTSLQGQSWHFNSLGKDSYRAWVSVRDGLLKNNAFFKIRCLKFSSKDVLTIMYDHKEVRIFSLSYIVNVLKESVAWLSIRDIWTCVRSIRWFVFKNVVNSKFQETRWVSPTICITNR